jgi:hypothetical protein
MDARTMFSIGFRTKSCTIAWRQMSTRDGTDGTFHSGSSARHERTSMGAPHRLGCAAYAGDPTWGPSWPPAMPRKHGQLTKTKISLWYAHYSCREHTYRGRQIHTEPLFGHGNELELKICLLYQVVIYFQNGCMSVMSRLFQRRIARGALAVFLIGIIMLTMRSPRYTSRVTGE